MANFAVERLPAAEDVYLVRAVAHTNPKDQRLLALGEVRDLTPVRDDDGRDRRPAAARARTARRPRGHAPGPGPAAAGASLPVEPRAAVRVAAASTSTIDEIERVARSLAPATEGLGIEEIGVQCLRPDPATGELRERLIRLANPTGTGFVVVEDDLPTEPLQPLDEYTQKVVQSRRRGRAVPVRAGEAAGRAAGRRARRRRRAARSRSTTSTPTAGSSPSIGPRAGTPPASSSASSPPPPTATRRAWCASPCSATPPRRSARWPSRSAGGSSPPSTSPSRSACPLEWFALSAGARIAMDSGTENMDWIAAVLRRLIEFTQAGHEVNVVVTGINVGAQPYWNAEATMLMHTKGILVMTPDSAMVLTGKQALDYSGSVSAEDNLGHRRLRADHGSERAGPVLGAGPAGSDRRAAGALRPHLRRSRRAVPAPRDDESTQSDRDVRDVPAPPRRQPDRDRRRHLLRRRQPGAQAALRHPHGDACGRRPGPRPARALARPDRAATRSSRGTPRWAVGRWRCSASRDGRCVAAGVLPADGPDQWTSGTLFPMSSKKVARVVNAASGNRPLVVLANLSGFDGSPESMRSLQLEFGAEIGRAVVNFRGPIVFVVVSRYHGGAFVVFSQKLNADLETIAVEGAHASVIGGAPAAAVVFAGEVAARTRADERVVALEEKAAAAEGNERVRLRAESGGAVGRRPRREARRGRCRVRSDPQRRTSPRDGLDLGDRPRRSTPRLRHRRRRPRRRAGARPHRRVGDERRCGIGPAPSEVPADDEWLTDRRARRASRAADGQAAGGLAARAVDGEVAARCRARCPRRTVSRSGRPTTVRPDAFVDGSPRRLSLSLSHRDGVAVAAVARLPTTGGHRSRDARARSDAFVREWLSS